MSSRGYIANQSICDWEQDFLIGGKWWLVISFERSWLLHLQWVQRAKRQPRLLSVVDTLILAIHKSAWLVAKDFDFIPIPFWSQCQMLLQRDYTTLGSILHSSLLCTTWTSLVPNPKELWIRPRNEARPEAEQLGNETPYVPGGRMQLCRLGYSCFLIWDWLGVLEPGYVQTWTHAFM